MSTHRLPLVASLMALGAGAVWSLGAITNRLADDSDAFQYLVWRSIGVVLVVEAVSFVQRKPAPTLRAYRSGRLMILGNVMLLIASLGFVYAIKTTTSANAAFLASTTPFFGAVLARLVLREKLTWVTVASIALGFVGLVVTVLGDLGAGNMAGNIAALTSAMGLAGYTVVVRSDPERDWSPALPGYGVMMIVICAAVTLGGGTTLVPPPDDIALALLHGGVLIVVGFYLFNGASRVVPAAAMTLFAQTEMVLVPVWALLFLDERPSTTTLVGGAIIFTAIIGKVLLDTRSADERPRPEMTAV